MKTALILAGLLILGVTQADAMQWLRGAGHSDNDPGGTAVSVKVSEPSSVYAVASGVALLGGALWLLRRK